MLDISRSLGLACSLAAVGAIGGAYVYYFHIKGPEEKDGTVKEEFLVLKEPTPSPSSKTTKSEDTEKQPSAAVETIDFQADDGDDIPSNDQSADSSSFHAYPRIQAYELEQTREESESSKDITGNSLFSELAESGESMNSSSFSTLPAAPPSQPDGGKMRTSLSSASVGDSMIIINGQELDEDEAD